VKSISPATLTLVMLLAVGGLIAAYVAKKVFAREDGPPPPSVSNVPMAVSDLPVGKLITEGDIAMGPLRNDKRERDMILNKDLIIGRYVKEPIKAAQPVRSGYLYASGQRPPLDVEKGMVAVTVSLGERSSIVDGLAQPGDYVDVHFSPNTIPNDHPAYKNGFIMKLFTGVKLIAVNGLTQASNVQTSSNTATLELTEKQANVMILAQQKGEINLALSTSGKGNGDLALDSADRVTLEQILGLEPLPEPKKPFEMEIYYGGGRSTYQFQDGRWFDGDDNTRNLPRGYQRERTSSAFSRGAQGISDSNDPEKGRTQDKGAANEPRTQPREVLSPNDV